MYRRLIVFAKQFSCKAYPGILEVGVLSICLGANIRFKPQPKHTARIWPKFQLCFTFTRRVNGLSFCMEAGLVDRRPILQRTLLIRGMSLEDAPEQSRAEQSRAEQSRVVIKMTSRKNTLLNRHFDVLRSPPPRESSATSFSQGQLKEAQAYTTDVSFIDSLHQATTIDLYGVC